MALKPDVVMEQNSKYVDFRCMISASAAEVNYSMKATADGVQGMRKLWKWW